MFLGSKIFVIITAPDANENAPSNGAPMRVAMSRSNLMRSVSASFNCPFFDKFFAAFQVAVKILGEFFDRPGRDS